MNIEKVQTDNSPKAIGPYSQGIKAGQFLFISGQMPIDAKTGKIVDGDIKIQTKQVLKNIKAIVEEIGYTLEDVVKTTIFLKDMGEFSLVNEIYAKYFKINPPARSCIEVARLPKDVNIEIEAIVFLKYS